MMSNDKSGAASQDKAYSSRLFVYDDIEYEDVDPTATIEDVAQALAGMFPALVGGSHTKVVGDGGVLRVTLQDAPKSNG